MKYKAGDKVKIRENIRLTKVMHDFLNSQNPPYTLVVKNCVKDRMKYKMKNEEYFLWGEDDIEGIYERPISIADRFEILDL